MNPDLFRLHILQGACTVSSFGKAWPTYRKAICEILGRNPGPQEVFDLGSNLSDIFQSYKAGRDQSGVSGGGTAWEVLAVWYLNLIFWNTKVLATKNAKAFVPQCIKDSTSVTIANNVTNTESDVIVYSVPKEIASNATVWDIDKVLKNNIGEVDLAIVQLKTNWNDNSQVPMLWDIVYNSYNVGVRAIENVQVGINGVNPQNYRSFSYSFMTVPTQKKTPSANNVAVSRVRYLSGGNYWGRESLSGVAQSFKEFFQRNFKDYFPNGVQSHISSNLNKDRMFLERFLNLDFD